MGADVRKQVTPEWVTVGDVARMRGTSRRAALRWIRRREMWSGMRLLHQKSSRFGKKLMLRTTDLGILVEGKAGERPLVPEIAELRAEIDALQTSHLKLMHLVGGLVKHTGYVEKPDHVRNTS